MVVAAEGEARGDTATTPTVSVTTFSTEVRLGYGI